MAFKELPYVINVLSFPQVYRSVLLSSRRRRVSGGSDSSKNGASGSSSPINVDDRERSLYSFSYTLHLSFSCLY